MQRLGPQSWVQAFFFSLLEKMRSLSGTHRSMFTNTTSLWNWVFQHLMYICLAVE